MSNISPIRAYFNNSYMPAFKGAGKTSSPIKSKDKNNNKQQIPWKKIGVGALILTGFIEFVLRRNPTRKANAKSYVQCFTDQKAPERLFPALPLRDEIIITEAAKGNRAAEKLFDTITPDAPNITLYLKMKDKINRAKQYYIEGRFDKFKEHGKTVEETRNAFLVNLDRLEKKTEDLYDKCIKPLLIYTP